MPKTIKLKMVVTTTIMAALETRSISPALPEVGQSTNAFFVNVTKCKVTAAAALLYPFLTHRHINRLLVYCPTIEIQFPRNWFLKDTSRWVSYRFRQYLSPFRPSRMRSGDEGMGSDRHISYSNQSSYFCLCVLPALLSP